jgi:DNA-binding response OmpR family regulator
MRQMRVLVVEDETINREIMAEALVDAGFRVDEAGSADEAVRLLDADGYQLLVTDIHMPGGMDGIGLAHRAHSHHPKMPIVFVTGRPDVLARLKGSGIPGSSLAKPFGLEELVRVVSSLIGSNDTDISV